MGSRCKASFGFLTSALKERWVEVGELLEWAPQTLVENPARGRRDLAAEFFQLCCRFENVHNKIGKVPAIKEGMKDKTKLRGRTL